MYRYHDEEWQRLKTTLKGQDGEYYHYSSQTPGFSTFMIAAGTVKHEDVSKTDNVKNNVTDNASTAPSAQDFEKTEKAPAKGTSSFGILLAVTGISIAFYSRKR
jgi:hypothetical protein